MVICAKVSLCKWLQLQVRVDCLKRGVVVVWLLSLFELWVYRVVLIS
jgi:hypothetical protein